MLSDIGYAPRSLWSEMQVLRRCTTERWSPVQKRLLRHAFAVRCLTKMLLSVPEDIYRFTRIFLTATVCCLFQACKAPSLVRRWKYWTNREIINLAAHSLETSVYQVGWAHPRAGLVLNVVYRIAVRTLHGPNYAQYLGLGFPRVEQGCTLPIEVSAVGLVIRARVLRTYNYAAVTGASILGYLKACCGMRQPRGHWNAVIRNLGRLVHQKLDVPRCELLMCSPTLGQRALWTAIRVSQIVFHRIQ